MTKPIMTLTDADMTSTRRVAVKTLLAKAGLAVGALAIAVTIGSTGAHAASDRAEQTDRDTGRGSDAAAQTDRD